MTGIDYPFLLTEAENLFNDYCRVHNSEHGSSTKTKLNCTNLYKQNPYY